MKKLLYIIVVGIFLISFSSAVYDAGIFEVDRIADIKLPCSFNGTFCDASSNCNVTVKFPNNETLILDNQLMTNTGNGMPNATLPTSNTTGEYSGFYICCESNFCDSSPIIFKITPNGTELSTAQGIIYIVFILALGSIFSLCLFGALKIPWNNPKNEEGRIIGVNDLRYLKIVFYVFSYILLLFIVGIMRSVFANFLLFDNASRVFNWMYWILFSFMWPLIVISLLLTLVYFLDNKKLKEAIARGVPLR